MDISIAKWVYETFGNNEIFLNIAKIITYLGNKWIIIAIAALMLCFRKTRKLGVFVIFACGATYILNDYIIKLIIKRDRPFVSFPELEVLSRLANIKLPDGYSMASGHAAVSMALAVMIYLFSHKVGLIAIAYSILVGLSRIVLGVHYFSDVLAGFAIGILVALIVYTVLNKVFYVYSKKRKKQAIVFASNNKHKLDEVRQILKGYKILSLKDIGFNVDVEENGETLVDNAKIKAYAIREFLIEKGLGYAVFSDDSGLFVEVLNGEPGVHSARYSEEHNDEANRQKLLKNLKRKKNRKAYFECVICYLNGEEERIFLGKTFGTITKEYIGDTAFGYDCIFMSDDLQKSFGEASKEEKDSVSHRGRAVKQLKDYIENN